MQEGTSTHSVNRRRTLGAALLVALCGFGMYAVSLDVPFLFDDVPYIVENPNVRGLSPLGRALDAPPGSGTDGRPVAALSLALSYALGGGLEPAAFRLFNVVAHVLCGLALLGVVRRALELRREGAAPAGPSPTGFATAVALLWVLHPLCGAAIYQVVYRTEILMALFLLTSVYAALRGFASPGRAGPWFLASTVAGLCAAGSKESAAVLPLVVLALDRALVSGSVTGALKRHRLLYAGLLLSWVLLAWLALGADRGQSVGFEARGVTPWRYFLTQAGVLVTYLRLTLWPAPLALEYGGWPVAAGIADVWWQGALVLALLGATGWALVKRRLVGVAGLVFFGVLAPTSSFIPLTGAIAAEHRMHLPAAAVIATALYLGWRLLQRVRMPAATRVSTAGACVLVGAAALAGTGAVRARDYADLVTIWRDTTEKRPDSYRAFEHYGSALVEVGELPAAVAAFRRALELWPESPKVHLALAQIHEHLGQPGEARRHYELLLEHDPDVGLRLVQYGEQLIAVGRISEGLGRLVTAVELQPQLAPAVARLAWLRATLPDEGLRDGAEALRLARALARDGQSNNPRHLDILAAAWAESGRFDQAVAFAERARDQARTAGKERLARTVEARLERYRRGEPWREAPR